MYSRRASESPRTSRPLPTSPEESWGDLSPSGLQSRTKKAEGKKQGPSSPIQCEHSCPRGHQVHRQRQRDLGSNPALTPVVSLEPDCLKVLPSVLSCGNQRHLELVGSIRRTAGKHPTRDCLSINTCYHCKQGRARDAENLTNAQRV